MLIHYTDFIFPPLSEILIPHREIITNLLNRPMVWACAQDVLAETPWQSRFGGFPYLPKETSNPLLSTYKDETYHNFMLLLQINFEEMPSLPGFPSKGILQFFSTSEPDAANPRMVFYPDIIKDTNLLFADFTSLPEKWYKPFYGMEYAPDQGLSIDWKHFSISPTTSNCDLNRDVDVLFDYIQDNDEWDDLQDAMGEYLDQVSVGYQEWKKDKGLEEISANTYAQIGGNVYQFYNEDQRKLNDEGVIHDRLIMEYNPGSGFGVKHASPLQSYDAVPQFFTSGKNLESGNFTDFFYSCMG